MFELGFSFDDFKRALWTALQAGVATFLAGMMDVYTAFTENDLTAGKAAAFALIVAVGAAVLSAIKNALLAPTASIR